MERPMERDLPKSRVKEGPCKTRDFGKSRSQVPFPSPVPCPPNYLTALANSLSHSVYSPSLKPAFAGLRRM
jgi:hypothetical protein